MNTLVRLCVLSSLLLAAGPLLAAQSCADEEQEIQQQLDEARQQNNRTRIDGLSTVLDQVRARCTEERLAADRKDRIAAKQAEVSKREADLREAQRDGDPKKIAKRERKLREAREELMRE
ncbi:TPA: DUF1090 domain-containing protein [Pseudomonas aeruginosa]|uniref:DUF1090 domain-containing protein n=1 Tax=Pseudomonas kuykendallii TaxID=1007099 RepID=A0A2W5EWU1_9PSED|nr:MULTISPECIES: DUF1090 domain-containing protein [Pseudomonas]AVE33415.1 DUF1090 domain-containing protein [Pseudomonas aeruginosa]EIU3467255.1 DUF1090 domain-containing protein [Pseudomonas aeruginosa]EKX6391791.1 DUF1090 domain-containing protein [Pseudomonas aeruginosa]KSK95628.1 hypothetical protein APA31_13250 [Pseudomonas aeruginosa]MBG4927358.1 DUF1090 domain-containing protein [Pseudomonas aeruginosa]